MSEVVVRDIYLVRHAQSEANVGGRLESLGDSPLTAMGRYQARKVAEVLAGYGLADATVLASPLQRASTTAAHIAEAIGCEAVHDHRLREGEVGWLEGLPFEEVQRHQDERGAKFAGPDLHGGESFPTIADRTEAAFREHLSATAGPVIVVGHGFALRALIWRLYGGEGSGLQKPFGNADVIAFKLRDGQPVDAFEHRLVVA